MNNNLEQTTDTLCFNSKIEIVNYYFDLLDDLLKKLNIIQKKPFSKNNLIFSNNSFLEAGLYNLGDDKIYINPIFHYEVSVILHELIHAFSSSYRYDFKNIGCGFNNKILNEGFTELLTQNILNQNIKILDFDTKAKEIIQNIRDNIACKIKKARTKYFKNKEEILEEKENIKPEYIIFPNGEKLNISLKDNNYFNDKMKDLKSNLKVEVSILIGKYSSIEKLYFKYKKKQKIESDYLDYTFLWEKIILSFSKFYNKTPEVIFQELQKDYFLGNNKNLFYKLKEVFPNFNEENLENFSLDDFNKTFGFNVKTNII